MKLAERIERHKAFWDGTGPSLLFIPTSDEPLYDVEGYRERFHDPEKMLEAEVRRAQPIIDWPTDAIPTVRPNLGVVFVPQIMGQEYVLLDGQMPCRSAPLARDRILESQSLDIRRAELMKLASRFYELHRESEQSEIMAYHPDTQGVFDIAHLVYGETIFYDLFDDVEWVRELLGICLERYVAVSKELKKMLGECDSEMIHGHGTPQGLYFPGAGVRVSEDTVTLLSPDQIRNIVLPFIERSLEPFGGGFVHFCGKHEFLFDLLCRCTWVKAIDLGNSEEFDCAWLLERCAQTDTVLYSRLAAEPGESWRAYTERLGTLVKKSSARCVLRPLVFPQAREACDEMLELWRNLTG